MGVGGEDDKMENGSGGGGGFFESFKVTAEVTPEVKSIYLLNVLIEPRVYIPHINKLTLLKSL